MAEQKQGLSVDEQESIAEVLLRIIASYPDFPKSITEEKINLDDLKDEENIGIFPTVGAIVLKKYISGSFEAQFPFAICYKCRPTSNEIVLAKRNVLDGLGKWMENMEYPTLDDGRKIQSIERNAVTMAGKMDDGCSVFRCNCTLKYFKKRS